MNKIKRFLKFIYVFILIGFESLENMSAVTTVLEENLVKKNQYVDEEDLIDAITLARLGPGATTANAVAYLGNKIAGFCGGVLATISYTIAPLVVILILQRFIGAIFQIEIVNSALKGFLVYISISIFVSVIEMSKKVLVNWFNILIFVSTLILSLFFKISYIFIIVTVILMRYRKKFLENT